MRQPRTNDRIPAVDPTITDHLPQEEDCMSAPCGTAWGHSASNALESQNSVHLNYRGCVKYWKKIFLLNFGRPITKILMTFQRYKVLSNRFVHRFVLEYDVRDNAENLLLHRVGNAFPLPMS